jgi:hypothetical protein
LSGNGNECKPLLVGNYPGRALSFAVKKAAAAAAAAGDSYITEPPRVLGRGLHSSTTQLNLSRV